MPTIPQRVLPLVLAGSVICALGAYSLSSTQAAGSAQRALRAANATVSAQEGTLSDLRAQVAAEPTATPTPHLPSLEVCPQEQEQQAASSAAGTCAGGQPGQLFLDGFADDVLVMNNGHAFGSPTLLYRVYKSASLYGNEHLYGTAQSDDLDPQWATTVWPLQSLWDRLELRTGVGSAQQPPAPGLYRIEVLAHDGHYLAQTQIYLAWSPNDVVTPTPVADAGS